MKAADRAQVALADERSAQAGEVSRLASLRLEHAAVARAMHLSAAAAQEMAACLEYHAPAVRRRYALAAEHRRAADYWANRETSA